MKKMILLLTCLFLAQAFGQAVKYEYVEGEGLLAFHILEVDPKMTEIKLVHAGRQMLALEKVSSLVDRYQAFAGVNGGFFQMRGIYAGTSMGLLKISGELLASPRFDRGAIGWMEGGQKVLIDRVGMNGVMKVDDRTFPIERINQPRISNEAVLYTSFFYPTTLTEQEGAEMLITYGEKVMGVKRGGNHLIPAGGWVYSIGSQFPLKAGNELRGREVQFCLRLKPLLHPENEKIWNEMNDITNGAPVLISEGQNVVDKEKEKLSDKFYEKKHARTAVGIKPDGHWVFVVVEKNGKSSHGLTIEELADLMLSLGVTDALNLDGGGSSTMVIHGNMVNAPAHDEDIPWLKWEDERYVSDSILIFLKAPMK